MTALKRPKSMDELAYYTRRAIGTGKAELWVFKEKCSCGALPKKPKMRAPTYECSCGKSIPKDEYEEKLTASIVYTCPHCNFSGETQVPFHRKKVTIFDEKKQKKVRVESVRFQCEKCGKDIDVTKKMK